MSVAAYILVSMAMYGAMMSASQTGAYRDTVLLNVAAALAIADRVPTLKDGVTLAADAIDSGRARAALDRLIARSNA